jgi:hypothetical protein
MARQHGCILATGRQGKLRYFLGGQGKRGKEDCSNASHDDMDSADAKWSRGPRIRSAVLTAITIV